ncbi:alkaline-phosphatase-like protein [Stachybotrys elegans]|uniref:Alkaline-phosphatase-like protein n=1 Tax=Stachybotrys elegans TaxID=80388 RepID=A0A8K0SYH6_9HYPO|nr:alkaline-phosphatase-like protein [Stachybotrys elegans]
MSKRPNFLIVVADDLGFSDIGPYGGEIKTPCLDKLAKEGLTLTGFHTASACSPTRAMLLSGTDNHIAGLGQMAEFMRTRPEFKGRPGYEGYLNFRVASAAEILRDADYFTAISGKWHLGLTKETCPSARGFEKDFAYLAGCGNHFNNEPQLDADAPNLPSVNSDGLWMENGVFVDRKKDLPKDFYSTVTFTEKFIDILKNRDDAAAKKPFFGYLAYTAPHWPLQAPQDKIAEYRGMYDEGPEALRAQRLSSMARRGIIGPDVVPAPMVGQEPQEWADKSDQDKVLSSRRMETYAAMVQMIDEQLQRVVEYLASTNELDNTFVLFMSDNGAEGKALEALPILRGSPLSLVVQKYYNNSLDNIGNADSFVWYGARWAAAATAPSRAFKTYTFEGGIRCPCIIRYPKLQQTNGGGISHEFTTCMDILPTMLDLAGVSHPAPEFRGREVVPMRGRSWVPYLSNGAETVHPEDEDAIGWELFGRRAIRRGNHKAVFIPAPQGSDEWELFDIANDPGENENLADKLPEVLQRLLEDWSAYIQDTGMYDIKVTVGNAPNVPQQSQAA